MNLFLFCFSPQENKDLCPRHGSSAVPCDLNSHWAPLHTRLKQINRTSKKSFDGWRNVGKISTSLDVIFSMLLPNKFLNLVLYKFSSQVKTAGVTTARSLMMWLQSLKPLKMISGSEKIYSISPWAQVHRMACQCHLWSSIQRKCLKEKHIVASSWILQTG